MARLSDGFLTAPAPPAGVVVRPPTLDDAPGVAALISARDRADFDEKRSIEISGDELKEWWSREPGKLATDAWIALADDRLVGFAQVSREGDFANVADESCVHPDFRSRGVGPYLIGLAEAWARAQDLPRVYAHVVNDEGRRLLEERGFENVRFFWRMAIELNEKPTLPEAPPGFVIRAYQPGEDDEKLHAMHQDAFAEHWEFVPHPLEKWLLWRTERNDYDPELWVLGTENDEIAGAALCFGDRGLGWVLDLAVGSRWRKRGLGIALLQAGFHELWRHGHTLVGLEVDSENETGATRLYERAGMRVTRRYATFEKLLDG